MGKLIIDGITMEPEPSKTILEKAREVGIEIPTLCYHKSLNPYGACRICLVETIWRGRSRLQTACTVPAWENEVLTKSEKVIRARRLILELMLAKAPDAVEIQALADEYGVDSSRLVVAEENRGNKCIMCGLCVRVCDEVMGIGAIGFGERGGKRVIIPPFGEKAQFCTTCGACVRVCPTNAIDLEFLTGIKPEMIPSEFDQGLCSRGCVYIPTPQAVPNIPVIDAEHCMHFKTGECGVCEDVCQADAIDFEQKEEIVEEDIGCIVVTTGYELYPVEKIAEYGYGKYPDVIDGLTFERLLSASGPTSGEVRRPSDGKEPKSVVFISCVGSRDPENHFSYCSKVCCMYSAKHAMLYKHKVHDGQPYIFYMDIRAGGKGYEEFIQRVTEEDKVVYLRGRVSRVFQEDDKLVVWGVDTLTGEKVEIEADLVVLAMAIVPSPGTKELAAKLRIAVGADGFLAEAHPKLRPVESLTAGYFLAGCGQAPKDIPEAVAQASGAAAKVAALFSGDRLLHDPTVAHVDPEVCTGCGNCVAFCAYDAPQLDERRKIAVVNEALCEGCGGCSMACPSGAMQHLNFKKRQTLAMVDALLD